MYFFRSDWNKTLGLLQHFKLCISSSILLALSTFAQNVKVFFQTVVNKENNCTIFILLLIHPPSSCLLISCSASQESRAAQMGFSLQIPPVFPKVCGDQNMFACSCPGGLYQVRKVSAFSLNECGRSPKCVSES